MSNVGAVVMISGATVTCVSNCLRLRLVRTQLLHQCDREARTARHRGGFLGRGMQFRFGGQLRIRCIPKPQHGEAALLLVFLGDIQKPGRGRSCRGGWVGVRVVND